MEMLCSKNGTRQQTLLLALWKVYFHKLPYNWQLAYWKLCFSISDKQTLICWQVNEWSSFPAMNIDVTVYSYSITRDTNKSLVQQTKFTSFTVQFVIWQKWMVNFTRIGTENVDPWSNPWLTTLRSQIMWPRSWLTKNLKHKVRLSAQGSHLQQGIRQVTGYHRQPQTHDFWRGWSLIRTHDQAPERLALTITLSHQPNESLWYGLGVPIAPQGTTPL